MCSLTVTVVNYKFGYFGMLLRFLKLYFVKFGPVAYMTAGVVMYANWKVVARIYEQFKQFGAPTKRLSVSQKNLLEAKKE